MNRSEPSFGSVPPDDLLDYADAYALDALSAADEQRVAAARATAPKAVAADFDARVRDVRETMTDYARSYREKPSAATYDTIMRAVSARPTSVSSRRRRTLQMAAAAVVLVVAVAAGALVGRYLANEKPAPPTSSDTVLAAPDARTAQARVGDATIAVIYSRRANAAVALMAGVSPPKDGTVYQMWFMDRDGSARSRGTMSSADVHPTTSATLPALDGATSFGISVEKPGGSNSPSHDVVVTVPLSE